jgi:hypothetical protein
VVIGDNFIQQIQFALAENFFEETARDGFVGFG